MQMKTFSDFSFSNGRGVAVMLNAQNTPLKFSNKIYYSKKSKKFLYERLRYSSRTLFILAWFPMMQEDI